MESWERIAKWMKTTHPDDLLERSGRLGGNRLSQAEYAWRVLNIIPLRLMQMPSGGVDYKAFQSATAFLMYQWDASHAAGLSLYNVLIASYNEAYILLRSFLELLLNGALFQCLAKKRFRETPSPSLKPTDSLSILFEELSNSIERGDIDALELESNSAAVFDHIKRDWLLSAFGLQMRETIKQVADWGMLDGIANDPVKTVSDLYGSLSLDVHAGVQQTNLGRAVGEGAKIFECPAPILSGSLFEFLEDFNSVMETAVITELNLLSGLVERDRLVETCKRLLQNDEFQLANLKQATRVIEGLIA
jgi:hypothetical protein